MDKFFRDWIITVIILMGIFTLNPPLGIFLAIIMNPIMIHDVLIKFKIGKIYDNNK